MDNGFDCMGEEWRREVENSQIIFYLIFIRHIETIKVKRIIKSDFKSINLVCNLCFHPVDLILYQTLIIKNKPLF